MTELTRCTHTDVFKQQYHKVKKLGSGTLSKLYRVEKKKPGADVDEDMVKAYLAERIVKWWMPDRVLFVDELPHTGTGKIQKVALRQQFKDFVLED